MLPKNIRKNIKIDKHKFMLGKCDGSGLFSMEVFINEHLVITLNLYKCYFSVEKKGVGFFKTLLEKNIYILYHI